MQKPDMGASVITMNDADTRGTVDWQLTDIIESIPAGFLWCDANDRVVVSNELFRKWFFPDDQDVVVPGVPFIDLLKTCGDPRWIEKRMQLRLDPGEPFQHRMHDGRVLRTFEKRTSDGGIISIHTDATALHTQKVAAEKNAERLQVVLESIDQGISMIDGDLDAVAFNERFLDVLEIPGELAKPGTNFAEFIRYNAERGEYGDGDIDTLVKERVDLAKQFRPHRFERTRPDGSVIEISGKPIDGGGFVTTYTDVTERKRAEDALLKRDQQLTEQNRRFNAALDNMCQGLSMYDKDGRLLVCNRRFLEIYDLPEEMGQAGTRFDDIINLLLDRGDFVAVDTDTYLEDRRAEIAGNVSVTRIQEFAGNRYISMVHQQMTDGGWVTTHEDVTELQRVQALVEHMAHHDELTGLPNRTLFNMRLEEALADLDNETQFAVMCIDLDRFKDVNDSIGHPMGDKLLKAAAHRLSQCVRDTDTIARLGGDEFAVLQVSRHQPEAAGKLASRICDILSLPFDLDGHQAVIGASIGIALAPGNGAKTDELLKHADMALYRAKNDGRGVHRFFENNMDTQIQARRSLEQDLRAAFAHKEFELHYQPLIDLDSDAVTGFEALLRWPHPERGLVSPAEFIPVAEEIGLITPLGDWVIERACLDAASWPSATRVAVNLSPVQFRSGNLVQTVFHALAKSRLRPQRLELEITERVLLQDSDSTLTTLHALRDMGVRIAMDDFGTGYSSLSYLRSFPFDKIKIDRSFISDLSGQQETAIIVNAVASLSRNLGMTATAEGVETESQRDQVRAAGYTEMQGFLISPARPVEEIEAMFLNSGSKTKTA